MICSLCHKESTAPRCEPCRIGINRYRRLVDKDQTKLLKEESDHMKKFEAMFKYNQKHGGYVPKFYLQGKRPIVCARCLMSYETKSAKNICFDCTKIENSYRQAVKRGVGKVTRKYEQLYQGLEMSGRHVPKLFKEMTK